MRIPKVFHRVWLGGQLMPLEFIEWGKTWTAMHPGWTMKLWTEETLPRIVNEYQYKRAVCLAQRADVIRYEIMQRYGGVYVDCDIECVRNVEPLLEDCDLAVMSNLAEATPEWLSNGFFACTPDHPAMRELVLRLPANWSTQVWTSMGPPYFTKIVGPFEKKMIDARLFQPLTYAEYGRQRRDLYRPPDGAYAVNHHSSLWYRPSTLKIRQEMP
jgi:inositol phosphorylceramide mannosyltransferase catalytic subunit